MQEGLCVLQVRLGWRCLSLIVSAMVEGQQEYKPKKKVATLEELESSDKPAQDKGSIEVGKSWESYKMLCCVYPSGMWVSLRVFLLQAKCRTTNTPWTFINVVTPTLGGMASLVRKHYLTLFSTFPFSNKQSPPWTKIFCFMVDIHR